MSSNAPCKGCTKRSPACHDKCEEYINWISIERQKKAFLDEQCLTEFDKLHINQVRKTKRRSGL